MQTRRIILAAVPKGMPQPSDFRLESVEAPVCPPNGVLVRTTYLSVDPYLRGRISGVRTYVDPILVGSPMVSGAVGEVLESQAEGFAPGDIVTSFWEWQEVVAVGSRGLIKAETGEFPASAAIGILGTTGLTAYFGITEICQPKAGETLMVSGAAGAVGATAGQIGKIFGCRVVGTAGSSEKLEFLKSIGFDEGIDYHDADLRKTLAEACPKGIDCYFDNVGGVVTDEVFRKMNVFGRVAVCGQIAQYNSVGEEVGPRPFGAMVVRQLRVEGFLVMRWLKRFPEARQQLLQWMREGKLQNRETVYEGFEKAVEAFLGLFRGENIGKAIVKL